MTSWERLTTHAAVNQLVLDTMKWEFDVDDKRHQSLTLRATVLLAVDMTLLGLILTGMVLAGHNFKSLSDHFLFELLAAVSSGGIVVSSVLSVRALTPARALKMPNIPSLLEFQEAEPVGEVSEAFARAYGDSVRDHRVLTQLLADRLESSGNIMLLSIVYVGIMVLTTILGRR